ncbi:MAG: ABC transporter permease [Alistipes sp.]
MEWLFARRYLLSRKSHSVINIIAAVSIVAIAIPVAAMVVLLSVFNGFERLVKETYAAVDADIEIAIDGSMMPQAEMRDKIAAIDGVEAVSFVAERQALLEYRDNRTTVRLRGVDDSYTDVVPLDRHITLGGSDVRLGEIDRILLGEGVAHALGIFSVAGGDDVTIYSLGGGKVGSLLPTGGVNELSLHTCGIFAIDRQNDSDLAIVPLDATQRLFGLRESAERVFVRIGNGRSATHTAAAIRAALGDEMPTTTREQKNSAFYRIMRYEKWGVFSVSLLVLVIASFSIIGTVIMLIVEKRDEQPTLRAMGADTGFLRRIFVRESILISGTGGAAGLLLGVATVLAQAHLHIVKMPEGAFLTDVYPVQLQATDMIWIFAAFACVTWSIAQCATCIIIKK